MNPDNLISTYRKLRSTIPDDVCLVAVSKTKPLSMILELYQAGQRDFGENKVQDLVAKAGDLPKDIRWHFIGHLQRNKVKQIIPFVYLIHSVDSERLLEEIDKRASDLDEPVDCLLQVHIAEEESKFGLDEAELIELVSKICAGAYSRVCIRGLMGMATNTKDEAQVRKEFRRLKQLSDELKTQFTCPQIQPDTLSMGMTGDYKLALEEGSNMLRIGSLLFGERH